MDKIITKKIYKKIFKRILTSDILGSISLDKEFVRKYVEDPLFLKQLSSMVKKKDYSCQAVYLLCQHILVDIDKKHNSTHWLYQVFQFALSKSFPEAAALSVKDISDNCRKTFLLYLEFLRVISKFQKSSGDPAFHGKYPLNFLTSEERNKLENPAEYKRFLKAFSDEYIYEMMKLSQEVLKFNTLDHICGVNWIALFIGRQLYNLGLPVDLGRISGAAAGHDIGKYGCKDIEVERTPYLHYHYTDMWFEKHNIPYVGHIAVNHSVWDLELENLPLESLILIYSDFRVKNMNNGLKEEMRIFSLKDSFQVILGKLDNIDKKKRKRYCRVYEKLKDFEDYMINLGVNVDAENKEISSCKKDSKPYYPLMHGQEVIQNIIFLSIEHNIDLMHELRDESSLNSLLELARSEKDWNNLREYLQIFNEYSTYLTQKQKMITLRYLYEQLTHPEDEIRRRSAKLIGLLIASFDENYRKEIPQNVILKPPAITSVNLLERYLKYFLQPDHKKIALHQSRIINSTEDMISSLFSNCRNNHQVSNYRKSILNHYKKEQYTEEEIQLCLIKTAKHISICSEEKSVKVLFDYIIKTLQKDNHNLRLTALEVVYDLIPQIDKKYRFINNLRKLFARNISASVFPAENYLNMKIVELLGLDEDIVKKYIEFYRRDIEKIQYIFLSNLKTSTSGIIKKIQIELLLEHTLKSKQEEIYTALHFCNILKVSGIEDIRNLAGNALVNLMPSLSFQQRNDIAIELLRALEMEDYQFTKYIPYYLGQLILYLTPNELEEVVDDLIEKIKQSDPKLSSLMLMTVGIAIVNYPKYRERFSEKEKSFENRLSKMIGILLNGFVHYNLKVKQAAFRVIGKEIFGSKHLSLEEKNYIFQLIAKKILTLLTPATKEGLMFLINCIGLNYMYKFISDYSFFKGSINLETPGKIAFFPGAFDPFSLSHKEIVKAIEELGFEIYLAVDEFSWSKRTQPHLFRKNIINISIADELNVYLYPEDLPVNIANPDDLKTLRENFPFSEVYIVVGSDVILNASAYQKNKRKNSIHTFSHIIFDRKTPHIVDEKEEEIQEAIKEIKGKTIRLNLTPGYEEISSTQIRNNIDENRDIFRLIDPLAQKYIYENSLYQREPQYKRVIQTISIDVQVIEDITPDLIKELCPKVLSKYNQNKASKKLLEFTRKLNPRILLLRDIRHNGRILGFSAFHWVRSNILFQEFKDNLISEYIRENAVGRTIVIDGIFTISDRENRSGLENLEQVILTETLSFCIEKDYNYTIFRNILNDYPLTSLNENLELMGFYRLPFNDKDNPVFIVDMSKPCIVNLDTEAIIKEPFCQNLYIKKSVMISRKRLLKSFTTFYPGNVVLPFNIDLINQTIVKKICNINDVSTTPLIPRALGKSMCVPFGKILHKMVVPNTVTKSLHTEKIFASDMKDFEIDAFTHYMSLENQVKIIRSFDMPVILIDDYLHKGYRIKTLEPLFKKYDIKIKKIIVGALSGSGKEIATILNRDVDCAHFIPNLRLWFNESELFPFIGGDALRRKIRTQGNLVRSINQILPYTHPSFIKNVSAKTIYNFSEVCVENALTILEALENEYQVIQQRKLTLDHLGEVIIYPRYPDQGEDMEYNLNLSPSHYLGNSLELLRRTKEIADIRR
ncbi:cytidyltransferase [Candidatus Atribacteria bacterium RBG_19FT_COMBO_35_14]|uniref:Cytidyltransferase n=1 Tax=Candidatus Sediminicultor quintus TaxID=1797291 RepID=A0A1F5A817_9BACT|nr:MAG: cytidyltransferase [Candidatus Atribacteria bacterium RBG_19FT_COMBO_35_14]